MNTRPIVHVVDDDAGFRKSVTRLLQLSGYETANYENGNDLLAHLPECGPGCILLDLNMPQLDGLQFQERLAKMDSGLPVVFLTGRGDVQSSVKALKSGAEDFLCKPASKADLLEALDRAIRRNQKILEEREELSGLQTRFDTLTPREKQVYHRVVAGRLNKQIAYELNTTERTIKAHRQKVMHKLRARSIVELIAFAKRLNATDDTAAEHAS